MRRRRRWWWARLTASPWSQKAAQRPRLGLVVSDRRLLTMGDAFRGAFPHFFGMQSWCFTRSSSCFFFFLFFLPWLALFDSFTDTHSISHISLSVVEFFLSLVPVLLSCSSLCWFAFFLRLCGIFFSLSTLFSLCLLLIYISPPVPLCIQINNLCTRIRLDYFHICVYFLCTCSIERMMLTADIYRMKQLNRKMM